MWQLSYPPANGASLGSYLNKRGMTIIGPYFGPPKVVSTISDIQVCVDFFFKLNLLLPYSLARRGINENAQEAMLRFNHKSRFHYLFLQPPTCSLFFVCIIHNWPVDICQILPFKFRP